MATHSSILAWEIPWIEEPGGLQSMGSQRVRHDRAHTDTHTYPKQKARPLNIVICLIRKSIQLFSHVQLLATPWTAARQASLSITNSQSLLKLMSVELVMPSNHLILFHPLFLVPSIFPSVRIFSNESILCIRGPEYWSFSFSSSPSKEYSGLISFRTDWFDLLAVQGTLKSSPTASAIGLMFTCMKNSCGRETM